MAPDSDKVTMHSSAVNNLHSIASMSARSSVGWDIDGLHLLRRPQLQQQRPASMVGSIVALGFLKHLIPLFLHCSQRTRNRTSIGKPKIAIGSGSEFINLRFGDGCGSC